MSDEILMFSLNPSNMTLIFLHPCIKFFFQARISTNFEQYIKRSFS